MISFESYLSMQTQTHTADRLLHAATRVVGRNNSEINEGKRHLRDTELILHILSRRVLLTALSSKMDSHGVDF